MQKKKNSMTLKSVLLFLFAVSFFMIIPTSARALEPVVLDEKLTSQYIGRHVDFLEDREGKLTLAEVRKKETESRFFTVVKDSLTFGFTNSVYWARILVKNPGVKEATCYLEIFYPLLDDVRFYRPDGKGGYVMIQTGDHYRFGTRAYPHPNFVFPFTQKQGTAEYFVRVKTSSSMMLTMMLRSEPNLKESIHKSELFYVLIYTICGIVMLYNLFIFFIFRDKSHIYLVGYIFFVSLASLSADGTGNMYLWPDIPFLSNVQVFLLLQAIILILFSFSYLNIKKALFPRIWMSLCIYLILLIIGLLICMAFPEKMAAASIILGTLLNPIIMLAISSYLVIAGERSALVYLIAFIFGLFGEAYTSLTRFEIVPRAAFIVQYGHDIAIVIPYILLSFGIADKLNIMKNELLILNKDLEEKVKYRTAELSESNRKLSSIGDSLKRYLPIQLVNTIITGGKASGSPTERRKITVFFSDIKAFTDTTDSLEAEELSSLLNEYLTEMTKIAAKHGGTIDKFVGDAIMIFFGAPESSGDKEDALRAVRMAIEMQARMKELQAKWFKQGIENPLQIRIGINTGMATVGDFGAEERLSYTTIGGQVNLASRLESICEPGKILISHSTWALVWEEIECRPKGSVQVKGIHHDVLVYEVAMGS